MLVAIEPDDLTQITLSAYKSQEASVFPRRPRNQRFVIRGHPHVELLVTAWQQKPQSLFRELVGQVVSRQQFVQGLVVLQTQRQEFHRILLRQELVAGVL